jgi:predicted alpha/beta-hydrolase family hydrolase
MTTRHITIEVDHSQSVTGLFQVPNHASACYVMAHGAGAGMTHPFMATVADGLHARGVATLRYQFPYMEHGSKRPDRPTLAHATVRAAVASAIGLAPALPLFAGGKSFGARMTSQAQGEAPLKTVRGLAFIGFPLHPAGKPSEERAAHLSNVHIPMLFLQGSRDSLAAPEILARVLQPLSTGATLHMIDHADHSFHVPKRSGTTDQAVMNDLLDTLATWMARTA